MTEKCNVCKKEEGVKTFFDSAGGIYDMPKLTMCFDCVCIKCWNVLCEAKSDLTTIAVQYHRNYNGNYKSFLKTNIQMNDNKFYRSNPIFRDGKAILVGKRRSEIESLLKQNSIV